MSFTYSTLKTAVGDYLECDETTFTNNLSTFIKESEDRIFKLVQLPEQRKNVQGVTTASNRFLGCPTDFFAPMSLAIVSSNTYSYLDLKHASFLKEYSPTTTVTGQPKYYSIYSQSSFTLAPVPDDAYTVELHYFYRPQSITESSDGTSWLGDNAELALLYGSLVEAYTFLKGEPDLLGLYNQRYGEALQWLKNLGEGLQTRDQYRYDRVRRGVA